MVLIVSYVTLHSTTLNFLLPVLHTNKFSGIFPSNMALFGTTRLSTSRKFSQQHVRLDFSRQKSLSIIRLIYLLALNLSSSFSVFHTAVLTCFSVNFMLMSLKIFLSNMLIWNNMLIRIPKIFLTTLLLGLHGY